MLEREKLLTNPDRLSFDSSTTGSQQNKASKPAKKLMERWHFLVLMAMLCFSGSNLCISQLSDLGIKMVFYLNTGSLLVCVSYFVHKNCIKAKEPEDAILDNPNAKRKLFFTREGKFDCKMILYLLAAMAIQTLLLIVINETFKLSRKAGLNVGIAQSIWASSTFFAAIVDRVVFGRGIKVFHAVGMSFVVVCAVLVALSPLLTSAEPDLTSKLTVEQSDEP